MTNEPEANSAPVIKDTLSDKAIDFVAETLLKMRKVPKDERLAKLSDEQQHKLQEIIDRSIRDWHGDLVELESALGMLLLGHHVGWKVLYLIHSKKTIRKYEDILGVKIRDIFGEKGPSSDRSVGLHLAEKASNFWKVVSGETKIEDRRTIK